MKPLSIIPPIKPSEDFASDLRKQRSALETSAVRYVRNADGPIPQRIRDASDMSGIPRGVIEELLKARGQ